MADSVEQPAGVQEFRPAAARWRRLAAYILDICVLALPTMAGGLLFFDAAAALGDWGRLAGFALIVCYFGYFNSGLHCGQTIGKGLLHIKVVRKDGSLLSPQLAGLRAAILAIPIQSNGLALPDGTSLLMQSLLSLLLFGLALSILYLFIFDYAGRSLHDLVTGTVVVDTRVALSAQPLSWPPLWQGHWVVAGLLLAGSFALPLLQGQDTPISSELKELRASVKALPDVRDAGGFWGTLTQFSSKQGSENFRLLRLVVKLSHAPSAEDPIFRSIEEIVFMEHAQTVGEARVMIVLNYGFNFGGVSSSSKSVAKTTSAQEWKSNRSNRTLQKASNHRS